MMASASWKASPLTLTSARSKGRSANGEAKSERKFQFKGETIAKSEPGEEVFQLFAGLKMQHMITSGFCVNSEVYFQYESEEKEAT
jgi:ribosomal protein S6E (S10)